MKRPRVKGVLSKDLTDRAIGMIRDVKASAPSRPWFMWFCPGANHAPHHQYIDLERAAAAMMARE